MADSNNKIYTKFTKHTNNSNEVVDANHINDLQNAINTSEMDLIDLNDTGFINKALDSLNNNLYANSMFADRIDDTAYIDFNASSNIKYINKEKCITVDDTSLNGQMSTTLIISSLGDNVKLNDFFLITDEYIPIGASIKYFLITSKYEKYSINRNSTKTPLHIHSDVTGFTILAEMKKNSLGVSPKIFSLATLFFDSAVEAQYGLTNPDLQRFRQFGIGLTVLYRDRALNDKLVKITEPGKVTNLKYNDAGILTDVVTTYGDDNVQVTDTLNYGDYLNSENITEQVLLTIATKQLDKDGDQFYESIFDSED